jgi:ribosomal protein S18 acetylase RimI-like enzyme
MPRTTDTCDIRAILETDRRWAVYALGDLTPELFRHTEWFRARKGAPALALVYRAFQTPVLFTLGQPENVAPLLDEIRDKEMCLSVRPEILGLLKTCYEVRGEKAMLRMILEPGRFQSVDTENSVRLGPDDLEAILNLYADGVPTGEKPDSFHADMLRLGVFFGVWEGRELVAAAGTHLVVPSEGVAAVGNIYTRRDRRSRGLAGQVASAVVKELLGMRLPTIALNVNQVNTVAIRVYERLGFVNYCAFHEGMVVRTPDTECARP